MKCIFLGVFFFVSSFITVTAQTVSCLGIDKTVDEEREVTKFETPYLMNLMLSRHVTKSGANITSVILKASGRDADYNAQGLFVTFDDGTIWGEANDHVDCSYVDATVGYRFITSKILHEDDLLLFKTKKVVKVRVANFQIPITDEFAIKFMTWANCIGNLK